MENHLLEELRPDPTRYCTSPCAATKSSDGPSTAPPTIPPYDDVVIHRPNWIMITFCLIVFVIMVASAVSCWHRRRRRKKEDLFLPQLLAHTLSNEQGRHPRTAPESSASSLGAPSLHIR